MTPPLQLPTSFMIKITFDFEFSIFVIINHRAVAHNCHGKTKSHGTTNFTHGKTKLTHGKTKKTSWSAVGQRLLFSSEMVRRVKVNKRNGDLCC